MKVTNNTPEEVHVNGQSLRKLLFTLLELAQNEVGEEGQVSFFCEASNRRLGGVTLDMTFKWTKADVIESGQTSIVAPELSMSMRSLSGLTDALPLTVESES